LPLTASLPIVVPAMADPVPSGMVTNLARPGDNLTGFTLNGGLEFVGLMLQLLKEAAPRTTRVAFLTTRAMLPAQEVPFLEQAAPRLGVELEPHVMDGDFSEAAYRTVFADLARKRTDALYVNAAAEHRANRKLIVDLAASAGLPAIY